MKDYLINLSLPLKKKKNKNKNKKTPNHQHIPGAMEMDLSQIWYGPWSFRKA